MDPLRCDVAPLAAFRGGSTGAWRVVRMTAVCGDALAPAARVAHDDGDAALRDRADAVWTLRGVASNARYTTKAERDELARAQEGLGRPHATSAALIPIKKNAAWWALAQDERRAIFEESSHHIAASMPYLPAVARRLHHSRDLGEPFDFLTWFEFAPADEPRFDELVAMLRATPEWAYVEREVDLRLSRA